jgi:hypothetical protein
MVLIFGYFIFEFCSLYLRVVFVYILAYCKVLSPETPHFFKIYLGNTFFLGLSKVITLLEGRLLSSNSPTILNGSTSRIDVVFSFEPILSIHFDKIMIM